MTILITILYGFGVAGIFEIVLALTAGIIQSLIIALLWPIIIPFLGLITLLYKVILWYTQKH